MARAYAYLNLFGIMNKRKVKVRITGNKIDDNIRIGGN